MNFDFDPSTILVPTEREQAQAMRQRGDLASAETLYTKLLARHPDDAALWLDAGLLADEMGEAETAIARLRHAATMNDAGRAAAWGALATVLMHAGRTVEAGGAWWRAVRRDPLDARAWVGLMLCAHVAGRARLVRRIDRRLDGRASRQQRRQTAAELWPHVAASVALRDAEVAQHRPASPLMALLRQSARALERLAQRHPDRADARFHLAICHEALGQTHTAAASLQRALDINPRYAAAQTMAERIAA